MKEYRGKGLGRRLLTKALDFCREKGFKQVVFDTNKKQITARSYIRKMDLKSIELLKTHFLC